MNYLVPAMPLWQFLLLLIGTDMIGWGAFGLGKLAWRGAHVR